ncbi:MAG TPA: hypothetical protein VFU28_07105 [Vicinamibacterales bacterium]|nr:hypothetical protein [Vicinamibacterales bacterium]
MERVPAQIRFALAAVVLSLLMGGCGLISHHPPVAETPDDVETQQRAQPPPSAATASEPESATARGKPPAPPTSEPAAAPTPGAPVAAPGTGVEPAPPQPAPVVPEPQGTPAPPRPATKLPAAPPRTAAPATRPTPAEAPPKSAAPATKIPVTAAPLDVSGLKQELKDTKAIGVFSKLTLKNQMDDLLSALRKFHQGKGKDTLADLRRSYELLVMKVLSLVQNDDKKLASDIVSSREAIWGILADPKKFAALQL